MDNMTDRSSTMSPTPETLDAARPPEKSNVASGRDEDRLYRLLQQHLNKQAVAFPSVRSGADIRFLKMLFTPDEARLALHLSYKPTAQPQVAAGAAPEFSAAEVDRFLNSAFQKGALAWKEQDGMSYWHVVPMVIGMYEFQDGAPSPEFLAAARDYMRTLAFGKAFLAVDPPQMKTIPINQSIPTDHPVATYDHIQSLIETSRGPFVAVKCICREAGAMTGKKCQQTSRLETCVGFGDMAAMTLRRKHGRELSRPETLDILRQNQDDGLVLQPANARNPEFVCSCCGCCCGMLSLHNRLPKPLNFWTSNYFAEVTPATCIHCGKCVSRCQVNAVTLTGPDKTARINPHRCIGCGLCVPTCPEQALTLRQKAGQTVPPRDAEDLNEQIMAHKKNGWQKFVMLMKVALRL